jgi:hypothetical protein
LVDRELSAGLRVAEPRRGFLLGEGGPDDRVCCPD